MEDLDPVPAWDSHALSQSTWEDMLNDLLQDPGTEVAMVEAEVQTVNQELLGLVDGSLDDFTGVEDGPYSESWWSAAPVDASLDQIDLSDLGDAFIVEDSVSLPCLSSEVSSLVEGNLSVPGEPKTSSDAGEISQDVRVSSPGSCSRVEQDCTPSSNSGDEAFVSSRSHIPIVTSCSDLGAASPDAGCASSDAGAMGRSCDNFAGQSNRRDDKSPGEFDDDAKRQSRLMRNRESATQSRLRKKSYIKELEAKCRAMESQMSMLHQTVAFTSAQNAALREELAHYRCLKGNGSKSGVMEPAALPSDSLPSESLSRHTTPSLSVKLELVVFLCHVLLLTLLQALPLKPATSGGRALNEARSERRYTSVAAHHDGYYSESTKQLTRRQCSSSRRRKRIIFTWEDSSFLSRKGLMFPAMWEFGSTISETSSFTRRKISCKRSLKRISKRSQYSALT